MSQRWNILTIFLSLIALAISLTVIFYPSCHHFPSPTLSELSGPSEPVLPQTVETIVAAPHSTITIDGHEIEAPAGTGIQYSVKSKVIDEGGYESLRRSATSKGASLETSAAEVAGTFNSSAPVVGLGEGDDGGATASGGSLDTTFSAKGATTNPLVWVGILALIGAGVAFYFGLRRAALIAGVLGVGLIVAGMFPGLMVFIVAAVVLLLVGTFLWAEYKGKSHKEALRATLAGVEDLKDAGIRMLVKSNIASHADEKDKATIREVKKADELPSERPGAFVPAPTPSTPPTVQ